MHFYSGVNPIAVNGAYTQVLDCGLRQGFVA